MLFGFETEDGRPAVLQYVFPDFADSSAEKRSVSIVENPRNIPHSQPRSLRGRRIYGNPGTLTSKISSVCPIWPSAR